MEQGNDEVQETSTDSAQELEKGKDVGVATEQLPQDETIITAVAATEVSRDAEEVDIVEEPQQADLGQPSRVETAEPADACTDTSQPGATHPLVSSYHQCGTIVTKRSTLFSSSCSLSPGALASTPPSQYTTCLRATERHALANLTHVVVGVQA